MKTIMSPRSMGKLNQNSVYTNGSRGKTLMQVYDAIFDAEDAKKSLVAIRTVADCAIYFDIGKDSHRLSKIIRHPFVKVHYKVDNIKQMLLIKFNTEKAQTVTQEQGRAIWDKLQEMGWR